MPWRRPLTDPLTLVEVFVSIYRVIMLSLLKFTLLTG
jgi:hypothetical protein